MDGPKDSDGWFDLLGAVDGRSLVEGAVDVVGTLATEGEEDLVGPITLALVGTDDELGPGVSPGTNVGNRVNTQSGSR